MKRTVVLFVLCVLVAACTKRSLPDIARDGDSAVNEALTRGHYDVDERSSGKTALHVAAEEGDVRTVRVLAAHHADLAAYNRDAHTALAVAALRGHTECVAALLSAGADPYQPNGAMQMKAVHAATLALYGTPETLDVLFARGVDANAVTLTGETALHFAAKLDPARSRAATESLLAHGANPYARDARGFTPLHEAAVRDNIQVVHAYVAAKLDLDQRSAWGDTPLDLALAHGADRVAEALAAAGALTARTRGDARPLFVAARTNDVPRVQRLLAFGADPKQVFQGKTALDVARAYGSDDAARLLTAAGASPP
jgi:ankyrin repeat protein